MKKTFISTILSLFLICTVFTGCQSEENKVVSHKINPSSVHEIIIDKGETVIIDVRTADEYESGHLANSINFPLNKLQSIINNREDINKDDEIIVYCRSGSRSQKAYEILDSMGYKNVKSMTGGIVKWASFGYKMCIGTNLTC